MVGQAEQDIASHKATYEITLAQEVIAVLNNMLEVSGRGRDKPCPPGRDRGRSKLCPLGRDRGCGKLCPPWKGRGQAYYVNSLEWHISCLIIIIVRGLIHTYVHTYIRTHVSTESAKNLRCRVCIQPHETKDV